MADRGQRGSVLLLMPAAVLIVVILGSLAVDRAVLFGAQRDLVATAQAAANDAAAVGVDVEDLRDGGPGRLDPVLVDAAVRATVAASGAEAGDIEIEWSIDGDEVVVVLTRRVDLVFAVGVIGAADDAEVRATARSSLERT